LYPETFNNMVCVDLQPDSLSRRLTTIESVDSINLPSTFVSDKGYELTFYYEKSNKEEPLKLIKRVTEGTEYKINNTKEILQSSRTVYETYWRIIHFSNNLN